MICPGNSSRAGERVVDWSTTARRRQRGWHGWRQKIKRRRRCIRCNQYYGKWCRKWGRCGEERCWRDVRCVEGAGVI